MGFLPFPPCHEKCMTMKWKVFIPHLGVSSALNISLPFRLTWGFNCSITVMLNFKLHIWWKQGVWNFCPQKNDRGFHLVKRKNQGQSLLCIAVKLSLTPCLVRAELPEFQLFLADSLFFPYAELLSLLRVQKGKGDIVDWWVTFPGWVFQKVRWGEFSSLTEFL